ncbi:slipin family protein [Pseudomarimonas arenosa]|uniref:Slipin family protein n=1 Tax=Pseudomarimonas arenosa TaxID=2774145 RepID=A0AAW3ZNM0_9GAMM|nr:slipin family protein [Pseudomarimonas arenosa]MBD8527763.1 slipin family protein [Pseudomarimonas arenosa]
MFGFKRYVIGDGERGLLFRNRRFERMLAPGVHTLFDPLARCDVEISNLSLAEYSGKQMDVLIHSLGADLERYFLLADISTGSLGLVYKNGKLEDVLAPGARRLYWRGLVEVRVDTLMLQPGLAVEAAMAQRLKQLGVLDRLALSVTVPAESVGLKLVDGKLTEVLSAGAYAFWNLFKNVAVEVMELRVQSLEVSGQELLTRDKVTLRVNLAASVKVADPLKARTVVAKYNDYVYRELQFGLRKAVSSKTLDELLGDKARLDADIYAYVKAQAEAVGVELLGVGVKDVILPGEMREILNSVVSAEKQAQANVIRRREEANATRSLLNTAKLIEDSPTLLRLKELEALEKVTEKIDKLTVFGGLDGVLKQLVTLKG